MKRTLLAVIAVACLAAGCSSEGPTDTANNIPPTTAATSSASVVEPRTLNVGDTVKLRDGEATLLSVEMISDCTYRDAWDSTDAKQGRNTHIAIELSVSANPGTGFMNIPSLNISERDPDGYVATSTAHSTEGRSCIAERDRLDTVDAGTKQKGWVLLATKATEGELLWNVGGGTSVLIPFPTSTSETGGAQSPITVTTNPAAQISGQELAKRASEAVGEPATVQEVEQMAEVVCLQLQSGTSVDEIKTQMESGIGDGADKVSSLIDLIVSNRCPR